MNERSTMSQDESTPTRSRRERSTRHPSVPLAESVELCKFIEARGLDGLTAADIATALGYKNIKTNTFSARLSAARQFGLLVLKDEGYTLTPLARSILHPVDPAEVPRLYRQALLEPPLYAELAGQFAEKKVPEATILGNVLYHNYQIISSAKQSAAQAFLESARFAGALGEDQVFRPQGAAAEVSPIVADVPAPTAALRTTPAPVATPRASSSDVRIDLRLWGTDAGKSIKLRVPESITPESFERLLQALRLHVRIEEADSKDEQ
jgi:hypothetical protein